MNNSDWIAAGASFMAFLSLGVSVITLLKTHLARFSPIFTVGLCTLRVYPFRDENSRVYIPSIVVSLSVTNIGAQVGKIEDIRIVVTYPNLPIPGHFEMFYPEFEVEKNNLSQNRFEWLEKAVVGNWMPFVALPRETKTMHLVFEPAVRWNEPVIQDKMMCNLEVLTNAGPDWIKIDEWFYSLKAKVWSELVNVGSSFSTCPGPSMMEKGTCNPSDLHKHISSEEEIPTGGFGCKGAYLDYPKKNVPESSSEETFEPTGPQE